MKNIICAVMIGLFGFSSAAYAVEWPEQLNFTGEWRTVKERFLEIDSKEYFTIYQTKTGSLEASAADPVVDGIFLYSAHKGSFQTELVELLEFWMLDADSKYTLFYNKKGHTPIFTPPGTK